MSVVLLAGTTACAQTTTSSATKSKSGLASTIGNLLEGVFTKSDLQISDLVGSYESSGPAVSFKSDNFLQKAGGIAGAAALETKLQPYYEQYGLIGMPMTIDADGNFTLTVKKIKISGTLERNDDDGTFIFNIMMGSMRLGKFTAYVEKSGKNLNLMFDATKLKQLISTIGSLSGMKMAQALTTILDSYDGACLGFKMTYTGAVDSSSSTGTTEDSSTTTTKSSGLDALKDILNRGK